MNKSECKKYINRAYRELTRQSKTISSENIAKEMERRIEEEKDMYIAYAKVAIHNLDNSASKITAKQLAGQIDVLPRIYNEDTILIKAKSI